MQVYGITGLIGSGKDEARKIFEKHGYEHVSTGDCVRDEARKRGISLNRPNLIELANELRKKHHTGILAERALKKAITEKVVVSGIRNQGEVDFLRLKYADFKMIKIDAPEEVRFGRIKKRNRENAPQTLAAFREEQRKDISTGIGEVIESTRMIITNNETLEKLERLIVNFLASDNRPDWDAYFLDIADAVGRRADCCRGRIGSILVRNKRVLATGYNGAPHGLPECSKVGCLLLEELSPDGIRSERCIRTIHADLNVIIQAALHGVITRGATFYGHYKPCFTCAKAIVQAGVVRVVVRKNYHDLLTDELFKKAGIKLEILNHEEEGNA